MDNTILTPATAVDFCPYCSTKTQAEDAFCTNCQYPLKGTEQEQNNFTTQKTFTEIDIADLNKKLKSAGMSLYYLAGIFIIGGFVSFFINKDSEDVLAIVIPIFILAILFLLLGAFSAKKPLACLISGLSLYIIVQFISN